MTIEPTGTAAGGALGTVLYVVPSLVERPGFLAACLSSIREQGVLNLDLVVVAPAGRGGEDLAATYGARFVEDSGMSGISAAINAGLRAAAPGTEFFGWLGDDDLLRPGSLRLSLKTLRGDPSASLVYGWCDYIDGAGAVVLRNRAGRIARRILQFGPNLIPQPGSLMRYSDIAAVGGLDETLRYSMDLDLFLRLRSRGRLVSVSWVLAAFRWHSDSTTVANGQASMEEADRVRMRYMSRPLAAAYKYARWPGRWALSYARWRANRGLVVKGTAT